MSDGVDILRKISTGFFYNHCLFIDDNWNEIPFKIIHVCDHQYSIVNVFKKKNIENRYEYSQSHSACACDQ